MIHFSSLVLKVFPGFFLFRNVLDFSFFFLGNVAHIIIPFSLGTRIVLAFGLFQAWQLALIFVILSPHSCSAFLLQLLACSTPS